MSTTGLEIFDSSLQRTHIWLDEIMKELGPDRAFAWHVLGAVLHAIRDRLPVELNAHFAAQLPLIVRGQFYDQWTPGAEAKPARSHEAFLQQIQEGMKGGRTVGAADAAAAVFRVLSRHLTGGQIAKVREALPGSIRETWLAAEQQIVAAG
jgi:uncharacterized protein (DUF2267 family)